MNMQNEDYKNTLLNNHRRYYYANCNWLLQLKNDKRKETMHQENMLLFDILKN